MNRLVTGNLSLVTGELQKLLPSVTLFSITSYQLPVTSYQSERFIVPMRGAMAIEATRERATDPGPMANEQCAMSNVQCPGRFGLFIAHCSLLIAHWALLPALPAAEPWADERLSVTQDLELWFDVSRQNAGRGGLQLAPITAGNNVDYLLDGSGHGRHLAQPVVERRPRFRQEFAGAFLSFDGKDDSLETAMLRSGWTNATVFVVASPRSNAGLFRAFFGFSQAGHNDYTTGLNFDCGPAGTLQLSLLNAEGPGFSGVASLWSGAPLPFGAWHSFALACQPGPQGVRLYVDGAPRGTRDRQPGRLRLDSFVLGARHYSNSPEAPFTQGFFHGDLAELLLYGRALADSERGAVEKYLSAKYAALLALPPVAAAEGARPLEAVTNPPPVQMFVPGFSVRELPLSLNNVNNVKYRPDGKLVALGYDGRIHLLSDTDQDGLEDHAELFWDKETLRAPIGLALTPPGYARGQGVFVSAKGKLSLIIDTNGDDRADGEIIVAEGWKELPHGVDALGVALDPEGNVYFSLGCADYTSAYLVDKVSGQSHYDLKSERGTILKVSPDFKKREILCTGIRFAVGLAFNRQGDLFCTDQEGATWLPNGNPFDELLHIQPRRHYGFPPRHPRHLPDVIDEPSVFDYAPQHQSTCGLTFNEPVILAAGQRSTVEQGPGARAATPPHSTPSSIFGPAWWAGDAFVAGYSRAKLYRTKLVKSAAGYVAQNQIIACLQALTVDACVSPRGDLVVATHSGLPDWGSGPNGKGKIYQVRYSDTNAPQPVLAWSASPTEIHIAFDRPLDPERLKNLAGQTRITQGKYVFAGDRFETLRPGYQAVYDQLAAPRYEVPVLSARLTADRRTIVLATPPRQAAVNYAVTLVVPLLDGAADRLKPGLRTLPQHPTLDLLTDLDGLEGQWLDDRGKTNWSGWLPHVDLDVAQDLLRASAAHEPLWRFAQMPGTLVLRGQLDLWQMLQPAVQPGAKLDHEPPLEEVTVHLSSAVGGTVRFGDEAEKDLERRGAAFEAAFTTRALEHRWVTWQLRLRTQQVWPHCNIYWTTASDRATVRPFPLRRFLLPWATPKVEPTVPVLDRRIPELAGGQWLRGKRIFFGDSVGCSKCHRLHGQGADIGPDLSNLIQRDYASVLQDIREPNAALNPDHLAYNVELSDGEAFTAVLKSDTRDELTVADVSGRLVKVPRRQVKSIKPSTLSLMPEGLVQALPAEQLRDLMTFLLTSPLGPAPIEAPNPPPPRSLTEMPPLVVPPFVVPPSGGTGVALDGPTRSGVATPPPPEGGTANGGTTNGGTTNFQIVLCAGPKDHGPGEHDYPLWQKRWEKLLSLADAVAVSSANVWPTPDQFRTADVIVFYSSNPGWNLERAPQLDAFLERGGGLAYLHWAVEGQKHVEALAQRIGLAWRDGSSKFRHGPLDLQLHPHPLAAGFARLNLIDESYWQLVGDNKSIDLVASGVEDGELRPLLWTRLQGKGRIFVSIPGHYTWTFDDPLFRIMVLRGLCWAGGQPIDRLAELATIGARVGP